MKTYVLHPGWVRSKNDSQRHYISARHLAECYQIPLVECEIVYDDLPDARYRNEQFNGLTHLYPRFDGDYSMNKSLFK